LSWQARVASLACKWVIKRPLTRDPSAQTIRKVFNANRPAIPDDCIAQDAIVGGVKGEWVAARGVAPIGTMLYIHGGAFVACSPVSHRAVTTWFARSGWRVFAPGYRLAPEHPFPAQIDDCVSVYRALIGTDTKRLVVAGDSAGGNLALTLCLSLRNERLQQPAALALFSPVTDLTWSGESSIANSAKCAMFSKEVLPIGVRLYLGDHDPRDPLASPLFADLSGLPAMLFHVGADEILRDDSVRMVQTARRAGIDARLTVWPTVPHVWQLLHRFVPEGQASLAGAHAFLREHVSTP
jgi:monoterpene epsilon-lactone hydrolase